MMVEELVVVRLYSGPLYAKYNAVLRGHQADESTAEVSGDLDPMHAAELEEDREHRR